MPRFYSPEWVAAFNEAVTGLAPGPGPAPVAPVAPGGAGTLGGTVGGRSRFRVAQVVSGAPEGRVCVVLDVAGDRVRLERLEQDGATAGNGSAEPEADVTVMLSYEDAATLSRGEVDAAVLVTSGRLKVRGNLSLLVAGQALLAAAAERLAPLSAATTY